MRRTCHFLLATMIVTAPMPVAAQVSVDLNALNRLGAARLPAPPPPGSPLAIHHHHHRRHFLARAERHGRHGGTSALASATRTPAGPDTIEHPTNLGPSFTSLPPLPGAAPPVPPPPPIVTIAAPPPPKPVPAPKPVTAPAAPAAPTRLAEATPPPPAAKPAPQPAAPNALPKGADRLTLPFFVQESDLPPAETAMIRNFAQHSGADAQYTIRAFASPPAGDDDPSTPRRISLERAQSVAAALMDAGVEPDRVRLLALGNAGGAPADRVDVIAMPPSSGHTATDSSP